MNNPRQLGRTAAMVVVTAAVMVAATLLLRSGSGQPPPTNPVPASSSVSNAAPPEGTVDLAPSQLNAIKIEPVKTYAFPVEKEALGSISFVDDLTVQVFPPYQGKLLKAFVELGDEVQT